MNHFGIKLNKINNSNKSNHKQRILGFQVAIPVNTQPNQAHDIIKLKVHKKSTNIQNFMKINQEIMHEIIERSLECNSENREDTSMHIAGISRKYTRDQTKK